MQEVVFPNWSKSPPACGPGAVGRTCSLLPSSFFSLDVKASPPRGGYSGYQIVIRYTGNLTLWDQQGITENRWPGCPNYGSDTLTPPANGQPGLYVLVCKGTLQSYNGFLANIHFSCSDATSDGQIDIIGGAGAIVSFFNKPSIYGNRIWLNSYTKGSSQVADSVHIHCASPTSVGQGAGADTDHDACADTRELGPNEWLGGRRDPVNQWDFFDPNHDGQHTMADVLIVVQHYGQTSTSPDYSPDVDRTSPGPNYWNLGPPNGKISIEDVLAAARIYHQNCN
jgi:hypothetical protein